MTINLPFSPRLPDASAELSLTVIHLEQWVVVNVNGPDAEAYLQGQVTTDVSALDEQHHVFCAHCNAKGKMWSSLLLLRRGAGFSYLLRRSVADKQLAELKKYAVFAKVTISIDEDAVLLGVAGQQADSALSTLFNSLPNQIDSLVECDGTTLLYFTEPHPRFLLITSEKQAENLIRQLPQAQLNDSVQWQALEIEAGRAIIDMETSEQLLPQAANIQALGGISFNKGCYSGQEMVARAKYRGANKRALYILRGKAKLLPHVGNELELKLGDNWRRTGTVVSAVRLHDDNILLQAVLAQDISTDSQFRLREDSHSLLTITALPYSLDEEK